MPSAQYNLALNYYSGNGLEQDYQKALEYYQMAAAQGHAKSINNIGDVGNCPQRQHRIRKSTSGKPHVRFCYVTLVLIREKSAQTEKCQNEEEK